MTASPRVGDYMSTACHSVKSGDPITLAKELMQFHAIRHLPVFEGQKLVGMVSLGDLYAMEAVMEVDPDRTDVNQAMSRELYQVGPDTPLAEVATEMSTRHIGSAMITEGGRLLGVFTTSDACRVLGKILDPS